MLKDWLRGSSAPADADAGKADTKKPARMQVDTETPIDTPESLSAQRREAFQKKLAETAAEGLPSPNKLVTYDSLFRRVQTILLDGNNNEVQEGLTLNISRNAQNTMVASKWNLSTPQTSHWEINLQMNGFSDVVAASWNTLNRYQLMYQRMSSTGAMLVTQFMAQKQQGMCQGTVFGLFQYPWVNGGCTQVQYVKDQSFSMSHVQRIIRGVHVGSNLTIDPTTHESSISHALSLMTPRKDAGLMAEFTPSKGTWKLAATGFGWQDNMDLAAQVEYKEGRESMVSTISFGVRKAYVGGAQLAASLAGFNKLRINLDLPFGGEHRGMNQFHMLLNCQYGVHDGTFKQGLVFTA